ncbi:hypothetical protein DPSP01_004585 [Paraphaeosphaeria sporulosa]
MDDEWSPFEQWSLTAIRDWAGATFPNAFAGLPSVDEIVFVKLDEEMMEISPFRLPTNALKKLMCIGLWDGIPCDPPDRVYAFLHGSHYSQVGYIREESHLTPRRYRRVFPADMKKVDVEEPLCFIAHGSERATLTRLGTLVSYYFVAAGHVSQFSVEESFVEKFEEACLYIEHGWPVIEDPHPESDRLPSDLQNQSAEVASDDNLPEAGSVFAKLEDLGGFRSDDTMCMGTSSSIASSPIRPSARARPQAAKRHLLCDQSSVDDMLPNINVACSSLENGNKRLKFSLTETRAKDTMLIAALRTENAKLETRNRELEREKITATHDKPDNDNNERKIAKMHDVFKRRFQRAQKNTDQADQRARAAFEATNKQHVKEKELEKQLHEQTARADAAEKKIADIQAYLGHHG